MKSNKILVGLLVVFIFLTLGLGGYIVYDKVLNNQKLDAEVNDNNNITDISMFPKESKGIVFTSDLEDLLYKEKYNYLFDETKNFQNVKNEIDGIKYSLSCDDYNVWDEGENCRIVKIRFDSFDTNLYFNIETKGCGNGTKIIMTNNYLIEQEISGCENGGNINVYNKDGDIVFNDYNSVYLFQNGDETYNVVDMSVVDNVVYYVTYDENSANSSNYYNLYFKSLNLSNMKLNLIQEFAVKSL